MANVILNTANFKRLSLLRSAAENALVTSGIEPATFVSAGGTPTANGTLAAATVVGQNFFTTTATWTVGQFVMVDTAASNLFEVRRVTAVTGSGTFNIFVDSPFLLPHAAAVAAAVPDTIQIVPSDTGWLHFKNASATIAILQVAVPNVGKQGLSAPAPLITVRASGVADLYWGPPRYTMYDPATGYVTLALVQAGTTTVAAYDTNG